MRVPTIRIRQSGTLPLASGEYVLYWMRAFHRPRSNFALQRAVEVATELRLPLVVLESVGYDIGWPTERRFAFSAQGLAANAAYFSGKPLTHYPYVERAPGQAVELAELLARDAAKVVVDDHPDTDGPPPCACELVDSNGLLPLAATPQAYPTAYLFRRFLQNNLADHLLDWPEEEPLREAELPRLASLPEGITQRFPLGTEVDLTELPLDHRPLPVFKRGGYQVASEVLQDFLFTRLDSYERDHNHPDLDATSGLSPYLARGHLGAHEVLAAIAPLEGWSPKGLPLTGKGAKAGWWGMTSSAEAFLDELVTWRELGLNAAFHSKEYMEYPALPHWARATLEIHEEDERTYLYDMYDLQDAATHDELWNAAQRQLVTEGRMHNYLRMLWGKKILEWSPTADEAHRVMIALNNRWALDGCDPNSYSGIGWVLGLYDRPWPERAIYGQVRYMSSANTLRKLRCREYLKRYAG